jgi:hypothetical protein
MSQHWPLFYFAHSAKNITDPKRRASVAQTSVFEACGLTGDPADAAVFSRCVAAASLFSFQSILPRRGTPTQAAQISTHYPHRGQR